MSLCHIFEASAAEYHGLGCRMTGHRTPPNPQLKLTRLDQMSWNTMEERRNWLVVELALGIDMDGGGLLYVLKIKAPGVVGLDPYKATEPHGTLRDLKSAAA